MLPPLTQPLGVERLRAIVRTTAVVSGATLVVFHGCLFTAQAAQGRLEDPWLVFRWVVATALVLALAGIRRADGSVWNRRSLAAWVLAALLHGPAVVADFGTVSAPALPETVAASMLESLVSVSALAITLWMLAGLLGLRDRHARLYVSATTAGAIAGRFGDGFSPQYSSRPPPH